jgi:hypothetical protein
MWSDRELDSLRQQLRSPADPINKAGSGSGRWSQKVICQRSAQENVNANVRILRSRRALRR